MFTSTTNIILHSAREQIFPTLIESAFLVVPQHNNFNKCSLKAYMKCSGWKQRIIKQELNFGGTIWND